MPRHRDHVEKVHSAQHQCGNPDIPAEETHQLDCGLDGPRRAQRQSYKAEVVAYFESIELYDAWIASDLFADHLARIRHLVEKVEPALFDVAYESV